MRSLFAHLSPRHVQLITRAHLRLARWAFERLYREFAWSYDAVAALVSAGFWRRWVVHTLPLLRGDVLELGCGTGFLQAALVGWPGGAVLGLDRSPQMLALTRRRVARAGGAPLLLRGDARLLPFPGAQFDTLVATFPTEYIADPRTLAEARRVLRPAGRVVVLLGAHIGGAGAYARLVDLAYRLTLQQRASAFAEHPAATQLLERMHAAGFAPQAHTLASADGTLFLIVAEVRQ